VPPTLASTRAFESARRTIGSKLASGSCWADEISSYFAQLIVRS